MRPYLINFHRGGNPLIPAEVKQCWQNVIRTLSVEVTDDYESEIVRTNADGLNWVIRVGIGRALSSSASGLPRVWVGGKQVSVPEPATTRFLKVYLDGNTACSYVEAMPTTMDSDAEVFDLDRTYGDIHLPGNFGGG